MSERQAAQAEVGQLRARADDLAAALGQADLKHAVGHVMERITEVVADSRRIEQTRNVIRSIWPTIIVHHGGDRIRLETEPVRRASRQL